MSEQSETPKLIFHHIGAQTGPTLYAFPQTSPDAIQALLTAHLQAGGKLGPLTDGSTLLYMDEARELHALQLTLEIQGSQALVLADTITGHMLETYYNLGLSGMLQTMHVLVTGVMESGLATVQEHVPESRLPQGRRIAFLYGGTLDEKRQRAFELNAQWPAMVVPPWHIFVFLNGPDANPTWHYVQRDTAIVGVSLTPVEVPPISKKGKQVLRRTLRYGVPLAFFSEESIGCDDDDIILTSATTPEEIAKAWHAAYGPDKPYPYTFLTKDNTVFGPSDEDPTQLVELDIMYPIDHVAYHRQMKRLEGFLKNPT